MKCKKCGKEFDGSIVKHSKHYDRGDGVMYGTASYTSAPICPYCGWDNSIDVYMGHGIGD